MRFGAVSPTQEIGSDPLALRDFAQAVEELGFSHLLAYDHVLGAERDGREPPLTGPYSEQDTFHLTWRAHRRAGKVRKHMHVTASDLAAVESVKQLKARYFRTLDAKDWAGFRAVFADDASIGPIDSGLPSSTTSIRSPDEFVEQVKARLAQVVSVHHGHMPEIELLSESEARGVWAMEDLLLFPEGAATAELRGYGHYHETYVRGEDGWKIASMRLTRLRVDLG